MVRRRPFCALFHVNPYRRAERKREKLNLKKQFLTGNDCYRAGQIIKPSGIMVHSTATPGASASAIFNDWNKSYRSGETDRQVCAHAVLDDKAVLQCLPWELRAWHSGGTANNTHIGFEICEPAGFRYISNAMSGYDAKQQESFFRTVWNSAVQLCVLLCREFQLTEWDIISHNEGYRQKIASNHGDVMHWFPKHGESMDTFRSAVKALLEEEADTMTKEAFDALMGAWQGRSDPVYKTLEDVPAYWWAEAEALVRAGAVKGDGVNSFGVRRSILQAAIIAKRYADSLKTEAQQPAAG